MDKIGPKGNHQCSDRAPRISALIKQTHRQHPYAGNDKIGASNGTFSGHSMRVGAAQDLLAKGFDVAAIMRAGGWKSADTLARYLEKSQQRIWL